MDRDWLLAQGIPAECVITEEVPACHLMDLIAMYHPNGLDALLVDAEGFDHEIIQMIDFSRIRPKLIRFEATKRHDENSIRLEQEILGTLKEHGYRIAREQVDYVAYAT